MTLRWPQEKPPDSLGSLAPGSVPEEHEAAASHAVCVCDACAQGPTPCCPTHVSSVLPAAPSGLSCMCWRSVLTRPLDPSHCWAPVGGGHSVCRPQRYRKRAYVMPRIGWAPPGSSSAVPDAGIYKA